MFHIHLLYLLLFVLHSAIDNAAVILQPVMEAIFDKMGLVTTVLLAGPIPNKGGQIKVRA